MVKSVTYIVIQNKHFIRNILSINMTYLYMKTTE